MTTTTLAPAQVAPRPSESPWTLDRLGEPLVAFVVHGVPGPQGSKKSVGTFKKGHKRAGQAILAESSKKVTPWRNRVAKVARAAVGDAWMPLTGALVCDMVFSLDPPAQFPKNNPVDLRWLHGLPTAYPDVSKLLRSTEDALSGIVWHDDSRIIGYRRDQKVYVGSDDPDALREPGVVIRVWMVEP